MSNELENQIKEEVQKDKINAFYKKYKKVINTIFALIILLPIIFQILLYYNKKKDADLLSEYLKAETLIENNEKEAVDILLKLADNKNETISLLSLNRLIEYYISKDKKSNALELLENDNKNFDLSILNELKNIKKVIINFNSIKEQEILQLLNSKDKNSSFKLIKKRLLIDFYINNNQLEKAEQVKKTF